MIVLLRLLSAEVPVAPSVAHVAPSYLPVTNL
jgi:hypothetical protein